MLLKDYLDLKNFETTHAEDGEKALEDFQNHEFDFCIFDVMMPKIDGFTLGQEIRKIDKKIPIVYLTVKSMKEDVVKGLKIGADDYLTKPFHMEELLLRIHAILRRIKTNNEIAPNVFVIGKYTLDADKQILKKDGHIIKLSGKENDVLKILCQSPNQIIERSYILTKVWNNDDYFAGRSMDVYITKLRKYLKEDKNIEIMNIHGKGFKLIC